MGTAGEWEGGWVDERVVGRVAVCLFVGVRALLYVVCLEVDSVYVL